MKESGLYNALLMVRLIVTIRGPRRKNVSSFIEI